MFKHDADMGAGGRDPNPRKITCALSLHRNSN